MPRLIKDWPMSYTVTVAELIAELSKYPPEMAVAYLWESQITTVEFDRFQVMQENDIVFGPVLLLDAET